MALSKLDRLIAWQQKVNVADAHDFMSTVMLIERYLDGAELHLIKRDVVGTTDERSNAYQEIATSHKDYKSLLLFTKLATDESIDFLTSEKEHKILKSLQCSLGSLFLNYSSEPNKHFNSILNSFREFLDIPPESFTSKIQAKNLYYALYLAMNYTLTRMIKDWKLKVVAGVFRINIRHYIQEVGALITKLETHMTLLQKTLNLQVASESMPANDYAHDIVPPDEVNQLTAAQQAMQQHFNQHYTRVLERKLSLDDKLKELLLSIEQITHGIIEYRSHRMLKIEISSNISNIKTLFDAFKNNEEQITGRMYFLDLKNAYASAYHLLIALSRSSKKDELILNAAQQERGSLSSMALHLLSAVNTPTLAAARMITPRFLVKAVNAILPDTLDSRAKQLVIELSEELLMDLRQRLNLIQSQINRVLSFLFSGDNALNELICTESVDDLICLIEMNSVDRRGAHLVAALTELTTGDSDNSSRPEVNIQSCLDLLTPSSSEIKLNLVKLIQFKAQQEQLLRETKDLDVIGRLIHTKTNNQFILSLVNQHLTVLRLRLTQIESSVQEVIATVARGSEVLLLNLKNSPLDKLIELLVGMSSPSVSPQLTLEPAPEDLSVQEHFNKYYLELLQSNAPDEEAKFDVLQQSIEKIETGLIGLLEAKKEQQSILLKAQQYSELMAQFQPIAECLPFIQLMTRELSALQEQEERAAKKIAHHTRQLSPADRPVRQKLSRESEASLSMVLRANQAALECVKSYRSLQSAKQSLVEIRNKSEYLSAYILEHNSWWVKLTNLLARLCSIFKTHAGRMIDEAKALNNTLMAYEKQCRQHIKLCNDFVKNDPLLGGQLLSVEEQAANEAVLISEEIKPFDRKAHTSTLSTVSLFQSKVLDGSKNNSLMNCSVTP